METAGAGAFPWTMVAFYAVVIVFIAARGRRRSGT
jgi:hypothetical protein